MTQEARVLAPEELVRITDEVETARAREALEKRRKLEAHQEQVRREFMQREVQDAAFEQVNRLVRHAAEQGQREVLLFKFPAEYCKDHGRAINNFDPDWADSLTGFALKAHEAYVERLQPLGYRMRAQVLNYPDGNLGEVGIYLAW